MNDRIIVAVDAMGGDNAPEATVEGTVMALSESDAIEVILVGQEDRIKKELEGKTYDQDRLHIVHASEIITNDEHPAFAIKKKKDSSITVALRLVREGKADAFVSAGSTGAVLVGGQGIIGRVRGVERPALAPLIPSATGFSLLIDCGASVDAGPSKLVQFAKMGSIYMQHCMGIKNPRVAIANIGTEETKGNQLVQETYPLLAACDDINFTGSIEARDIPEGGADVIVCEAFTGNVILKMYEGVSNVLLRKMKEVIMSSLKTKIGGALIQKELKQTMKAFDTSDYGGAPLLGLRNLVVKAHGSSKSKEIGKAILQCVAFSRQSIPEKIEMALAKNKEEA